MNKVSNWVFGLVFGPLIALLLFSVQTLNIPLIWVACIGLLASLVFSEGLPLRKKNTAVQPRTMKQSAVPILITFQISAWAAVCMHFYTKSIPKAALAYLVTCGVIVALYKAYITLTSPKSGNDSPTSSNSPVA